MFKFATQSARLRIPLHIIKYQNVLHFKLFRTTFAAFRPKSTLAVQRLSITNNDAQINSNEITTEKEILDSLLRLEEYIEYASTTSFDKVLEELKFLHKRNFTIPESYFKDSILILSQRQDSLRVELILRLAQENVILSRGVDNAHLVSLDNDSNPFAHLVTIAIGELMRSGRVDDALGMWVRMHHSGYVTNRNAFEELLDSVIRGNHALPVDFFEKLHTTMTNNLWSHSPK